MADHVFFVCFFWDAKMPGGLSLQRFQTQILIAFFWIVFHYISDSSILKLFLLIEVPKSIVVRHSAKLDGFSGDLWNLEGWNWTGAAVNSTNISNLTQIVVTQQWKEMDTTYYWLYMDQVLRFETNLESQMEAAFLRKTTTVICCNTLQSLTSFQPM